MESLEGLQKKLEPIERHVARAVEAAARMTSFEVARSR